MTSFQPQLQAHSHRDVLQACEPMRVSAGNPACVRLTAVAVCLMAIALTTQAQEPAPATAQATVQAAPAAPESAQVQSAPQPAVGDFTRGLLAMQRSGERASATPRPIDASVAAIGHERYLNSFRHPIPEAVSPRTESGGAGASGR